jgi:hypothetical protein
MTTLNEPTTIIATGTGPAKPTTPAGSLVGGRPAIAPRRGTTHAKGRERVKQVIRRRAGRICGMLLVLALLLPLLITSLLGGR